MREKVTLELDNALGHEEQGPLPLMDTLDQPRCCPELFLNVVFGFAFLGEESAVGSTDLQPGQSIFIESHHIFLAELMDIYVWLDIMDLALIKIASRFGVKRGDDFYCLVHLFYGNAEVFGKALEAPPFQRREMIPYDCASK